MSDESNTVFIGNKPVTAYVMACVTQFNKGAASITLKARGRAISRAVDVAEVLQRRFLKDSVEVTNISQHGIWLFIRDTEYFLPFDEYPWFKDARVGDIMEVELLNDHHIRWENLDVDLDIESLVDPEKYPLIYRN